MPPPAARVPMVAPDAAFVNMLRYGMLALRLLPESSCKSECKMKCVWNNYEIVLAAHYMQLFKLFVRNIFWPQETS